MKEKEKMEKQTKSTKSNLEILLEKNAYGEGLTPEEKEKALLLITFPKYGERNCWICEMSYTDDNNINKYMTPICVRSMRYMLF